MTKKQKQEIYNELYGNIPDNLEDRLKMLFDCKTSEKVKSEVDHIIEDYKKIKKKKISFTWYTEPQPSHRPRVTFKTGFAQTYVPGAKINRVNFQEFFNNTYPKFSMIDTPMIFKIKSFNKTPSSFNRVEKILAELGIIRPWGRTNDIDNIYKAYTDCTIGSLILDDSLIDEMHAWKYYSIKPRIEIEIIYMERFPKNIKNK